MQDLDHALFRVILWVVCAVSNLEGWGQVTLQDKEQSCSSAATHYMYNIYLYHTASPPWDLGVRRTKANMLMHMLLAVPGVNKVICLWPRSLLSSTSTCEIVKGYLQVEWNQIPNPPICLLAIYQPLQSNIQHLNLKNTIISSFTIHFKQTYENPCSPQISTYLHFKIFYLLIFTFFTVFIIFSPTK